MSLGDGTCILRGCPDRGLNSETLRNHDLVDIEILATFSRKSKEFVIIFPAFDASQSAQIIQKRDYSDVAKLLLEAIKRRRRYNITHTMRHEATALSKERGRRCRSKYAHTRARRGLRGWSARWTVVVLPFRGSSFRERMSCKETRRAVSHSLC